LKHKKGRFFKQKRSFTPTRVDVRFLYVDSVEKYILVKKCWNVVAIETPIFFIILTQMSKAGCLKFH
jgi:sporulation protein YlmC with PRC-barrel domain